MAAIPPGSPRRGEIGREGEEDHRGDAYGVNQLSHTMQLLAHNQPLRKPARF